MGWGFNSRNEVGKFGQVQLQRIEDQGELPCERGGWWSRPIRHEIFQDLFVPLAVF